MGPLPREPRKWNAKRKMQSAKFTTRENTTSHSFLISGMKRTEEQVKKYGLIV